MKHIPTQLERVFAANEGITTPDIVFADMDAAMRAELEKADIERTIARRVQSMLKYVFGACQKKLEKRDTAERATAPLERIVSENISEMGDPRLLMEEYVTDEVFNPAVAEALAVMEDTLHEKKDKTMPAAGKTTLRDLLKRREQLTRLAI